MSLFTAEGLIRAHVRSMERGTCHPPSIILHAYLRWLRTQDETSTHQLFTNNEFPDGWLVKNQRLFSQRAPGNTCLAALKRIPDDLFATNNSKGCGGIMRVAPIGLAVPPGDRSGWPAFELGADSSHLTHGHPAGYLSGGYFAELIAQLVVGKPLRQAIDTARAPLERRQHADAVLLALDRALRLAEGDEPPTPERIETLGGGWVAEEALAIAVYCSLVARDFEHGVRLAVNHSGDSDSTGSLVGNILGTVWSVDAIPRRWREHVELIDVIEVIAADLAAVRAGTIDTRAAQERYPGW
jgi:ADP-ribosylglycohydrolase